jgi:outer membrane lipoprotein SlyB
MMFIEYHRVVVKTLTAASLAGILAGCAAKPALPPQAPAVVPMGQMTLGRIVAVRPVTIAAGQGDAGLNAVLGALNQSAAPLPASGEEFVIRQDDGNTVTVSEDAPGFAVGDEVGIVAGAQTTLIHR